MSLICPAYKLPLLHHPFETDDAERDEFYIWKDKHKNNNYVAKDREGHCIESATTLKTLGENGTPLLMDNTFLKAIQAFNRAQIPLRIVHGKGVGLHGVLRVTHDIRKYCRAKVFAPGTVTEMFGRFSSNDFLGQPDTSNNQAHTMCMKFYTEEGNFDILTLNFPVFDVRDPISFIFNHTRSTQQNPQTGLTPDPNALWDFISERNERFQFVVRANSDQGFPRTFRHMDAFPVSIYHFENEDGQLVNARFHFKTDQGNKSFTKKKSDKLALSDPHYQLRDLINTIAKGEVFSFSLKCQIMTEERRLIYEGATGFDAYDNSKFWPEDQFPLIPIGTLTYNRLANNHFEETEQFAVDPGNLVPGIQVPPMERVFQGRLMAYNDAQVHRIGPNHAMLPINRPKGVKDKLMTYFRDGPMSSDSVSGGGPPYYPNSFNGPKVKPDLASGGQSKGVEVEGVIGRYDLTQDGTNFTQVKDYLMKDITLANRKRTADNIGEGLIPAETFIQDKILKLFRENVGSDFAELIQNRMNGGRNTEDDEDEEKDIIVSPSS